MTRLYEANNPPSMLCTMLQDGPEDDDSWTTNGQADLEAELTHRQKELDSNVAKHAKRAAKGLNESDQAPEFDPSDMVAKLNVGFHNLMRLLSIALSVRCMRGFRSLIHCTHV